MIRSYYRCCCINEPVIPSHRVHLKLGHRFNALLKVCSDRDDAVPLNSWGSNNSLFKIHTVLRLVALHSEKDKKRLFAVTPMYKFSFE